MSLKKQILEDTKEAMKSRNQAEVNVLRMVRAKVLEKEVELRRDKGRDYELNDEEMIAVISAYAKQRRQSIDSYRQASRDDLVKQEQHELEIVEKYLPRQLSDEEIEKIVEQVVQEMGATGLQAMGQVMRAVMPKVKGAADGKRVNAMVKQKLSS